LREGEIRSWKGKEHILSGKGPFELRRISKKQEHTLASEKGEMLHKRGGKGGVLWGSKQGIHRSKGGPSLSESMGGAWGRSLRRKENFPLWTTLQKPFTTSRQLRRRRGGVKFDKDEREGKGHLRSIWRRRGEEAEETSSLP